MTLPLSYKDREQGKFREANDGGILVAVKALDAGNLLEGVTYDYIGATYPTTSSEVYTYKNGGSSGNITATVTVTYTDDTKAILSSVERS